MTVNDVVSVIEAVKICGDGNKDFNGVYVGDLLSRAMSRVKSNNIWVTIMSNVNVIAVATLTEPAAVVLAENTAVGEDVIKSAEDNGITIISTGLSAYEICVRIHEASCV